MKSLKNRLLGIGILICLTTQISVAIAEDDTNTKIKPQHCEHGAYKPIPEGNMDMMVPLPPYLHNLDLTDAQKDKVFAITYALIPKLRDTEKQKHETMKALKKLTNSVLYDEAKAQSLAIKLASLDKELILLRVGTDAKIYALLTADQKQKVKAFEDSFERAPHAHMPLPYSPIKFQQQQDMHKIM
ncbi:MAG: Spy/CpxP family protein refolding chaperone [Methylophilus sp.]